MRARGAAGDPVGGGRLGAEFLPHFQQGCHLPAGGDLAGPFSLIEPKPALVLHDEIDLHAVNIAPEDDLRCGPGDGLGPQKLLEITQTGNPQGLADVPLEIGRCVAGEETKGAPGNKWRSRAVLPVCRASVNTRAGNWVASLLDAGAKVALNPHGAATIRAG